MKKDTIVLLVAVGVGGAILVAAYILLKPLVDPLVTFGAAVPVAVSTVPYIGDSPAQGTQAILSSKTYQQAGEAGAGTILGQVLGFGRHF